MAHNLNTMGSTPEGMYFYCVFWWFVMLDFKEGSPAVLCGVNAHSCADVIECVCDDITPLVLTSAYCTLNANPANITLESLFIWQNGSFCIWAVLQMWNESTKPGFKISNCFLKAKNDDRAMNTFLMVTGWRNARILFLPKIKRKMMNYI